MHEHVLQKRGPRIVSNTEDLQKQIYDLRVIYSEDLASFINRASILHKNIILSIQDVSPNLLFEIFLTQLMTCQGLTPFLGTKYSGFFQIQS